LFCTCDVSSLMVVAACRVKRPARRSSWGDGGFVFGFCGGGPMPSSKHKTDCEVAVIGAGPYGLGVAAHLKAAKIETRVFGEAMSFWQRHMPKQMMLRSSLTASDLSDADEALPLRAYADLHGIALSYPVPIDTFIDYGKWFQGKAVSDLDPRRVV